MQFDIVINGAGMVGSSLAIGLADAGFKVLVIENRPLHALYPNNDYGLRVSAFTPSSKKWLQYVHVWDKIGISGRTCPFLHMKVWDEGGSGSLQFNAADTKAESLGWIVDNAVVQGALLDVAQQHPQITLWENVSLKTFEHLNHNTSTTGLKLTSNDDQIIHCDLLIGADGGHSLVRDWAGIPSIGWSYGQKTIVGQVKPSVFHDNTCWQRFLKNGPIALLPLADGRCSLAWHTTPEEADYLLKLSPEEFSEKMRIAFDDKFGEITVEGQLGAFPLRLNHAKSYAKQNMVIAGDAAHNIHPLAGLGVNLGFMDAGTLTEELINAKNNNLYIGDLCVLQKYECRRKPHNILIMGSMDAFKRSADLNTPILRWTRNIGLSMVNKLPLLKNSLANIAMGQWGDLPNFMKNNKK